MIRGSTKKGLARAVYAPVSYNNYSYMDWQLNNDTGWVKRPIATPKRRKPYYGKGH
jgi:hypothetical protein